jgi:hypothetical protein
MPSHIPDIVIPLANFIPPTQEIQGITRSPLQIAEDTTGINIVVSPQIGSQRYPFEFTISTTPEAEISTETTISQQITAQIGATIRRLAEGNIGSIFGVTRVIGFTVGGDFSLGGSIHGNIDIEYVRTLTVSVTPIE